MDMTATGARPRVVIVGGGFGGLYAARALRRAPVEVILIDRRNHHLFQPLLYQVATAALNPSDIAVPIRSILRRQKNATVLLGEARSVDIGARRLVLDTGPLPYDYLILATGVTHSYFGREDWAPYAPGLKSIEDAIEIRRRVLLAFESAEREPDDARRRQWMTFVIVGGGPTGVELAGALAEIARHTLARDFRRIDPSQARVVLVEGLDRVLPPYPPVLSEKAKLQLERLGVEVRTGARVTSIDELGLSIGEERLATRTVLWAAGVSASPIARSLGVPLDRSGRVRVTPELTVPGHPELFVVGDLADAREGEVSIPGVAPAAIQMGGYAAEAIVRTLEGLPRNPFHFHNRGLIATIGRGAAVAAFPKWRASGLLAWWAWLVVHIYFLIGFRNRLFVLLGWAWAYLTWSRGARLITGDDLPPRPGTGASAPRSPHPLPADPEKSPGSA
jgi:NADH dehydrogenase